MEELDKMSDTGKRKYPEILAPAGSMESLYAAINAGCDAVYIGGSKFGARVYADNPECDEMIKAIEYCHIHGVKIYMTVNTLLKDKEIEYELYNYLKPYYEAGLDAVIVQDVGVMRMIHMWFKELEIHASTQMTLTMGKSVKVLKDYGVTRIVPARELTLEEIKEMRCDTDVELEVFVHGALCYCYSGQCLFSSMLGGRSGNRGRCAQPCRMPYDVNGQAKGVGAYILSPKELSNLPYAGEMIEAGIDSFKIEGRMKKPEYTAFVTAMYRKYVNLYMELGRQGYYCYIAEHQDILQNDMELLAEVYNREGFTQGYLEGKSGVPGSRLEKGKGGMLASARPKHGGVCVGEVLSAVGGVVKYKLCKDINAQDVVEFRDSNMLPEYEYTIGTDGKNGNIIEAKYKKGCIIHKNDKVYRTRNAKIINDIRSRYIEVNKKVAVGGRFEAHAGEQVCFKVKHKNIEIEVFGDICQCAKKNPSDKVAVRKALTQTGNTDFEFAELEVIMENNLFLPVGMLKNMRRQALEKLREKIVVSFKRKISPDEYKKFEENEKKSFGSYESYTYKASVMTMSQLDIVLKYKKFSEVYIKTELMSNKELLLALEKVKACGKKCFVVMPHIFRKNVWDYEEKLVRSGKSIYLQEWDGYIIKNFEEYTFLEEVLAVDTDKIITDSGLYVMNKYSCKFWEEQGVVKHTIPFELTEDEMYGIAGKEGMEMVIYTHIPLMVSAQCVMHNTKGCAGVSGRGKNSNIEIADKKGRMYTVVNYCKYCYNVIYQGQPMYLEAFVERLCNAGIRSFRYDFTVETSDLVDKILSGRCKRDTHNGHYILGVE